MVLLNKIILLTEMEWIKISIITSSLKEISKQEFLISTENIFKNISELLRISKGEIYFEKISADLITANDLEIEGRQFKVEFNLRNRTAYFIDDIVHPDLIEDSNRHFAIKEFKEFMQIIEDFGVEFTTEFFKQSVDYYWGGFIVSQCIDINQIILIAKGWTNYNNRVRSLELVR